MKDTINRKWKGLVARFLNYWMEVGLFGKRAGPILQNVTYVKQMSFMLLSPGCHGPSLEAQIRGQGRGEREEGGGEMVERGPMLPYGVESRGKPWGR